MTTIAHLSDLHLLEEGHERRATAGRVRLGFLSFGRRLDAVDRRRRARDALRRAYQAGADHVILTGDLTEDGVDAQFEVLADVLHAAPFADSQVTLIPGNHDAYDDAGAFARALDGPLRRWAPTSRAGMPLELDEVTVVPVSTSMHQHYTRSAGRIEGEQLENVHRVASDARGNGRAVIAAVHHPPLGWAFPPANWIDGLANRAAMRGLFEAHPNLHALHGHTHSATDDVVTVGEAARIFSTQAVVDAADPVRIYHCGDGRVAPSEQTPATPERPPIFPLLETAPAW
jgi:Icc protein